MTTPATNEATATFVTFPVSMTDPYLLLPLLLLRSLLPLPASKSGLRAGGGREGGTDCGEAEGAGGYGKCDALQV